MIIRAREFHHFQSIDLRRLVLVDDVIPVLHDQLRQGGRKYRWVEKRALGNDYWLQ